METNFIYAYLLIIIALLYSYFKNYRLERELFISSLRAFVQLALLGYILVYLFTIESLWVNALVFFVMLTFASFVARKRARLGRHSYGVAFASIGLAAFVVLLTLFSTGAISMEAKESIPMTGLVIGNAVNAYTLCMDRLKSQVQANMAIIEGKLSLGASFSEAIREDVRTAIKNSLIPQLNTLQTIGLVFIPGIMTGMIMAGVSPEIAFAYQLTIIYTIVGISLFAAIFATWIGQRYVFLPKEAEK